ERLLESCPGLTVLATSREPLGIDGEVTWRMPSLTVAAEPSLAAVTASEAGRIFVDRATRVRPNFRLSGANVEAVATICERLDGIPLAIELAAARVRVMSPQQIVTGLEDRFRLLTGGARSALPRQRTLEASVDWSHDLLTDQERIVLRRLGGFAGTFTLDGDEAVAGGRGIDDHAVLDLLTGLVDRSLVQVRDDGPHARYRLLETIRDYARRRLVDAGEAAEVSDAHLEFYASLAADAAPDLVGPHGDDSLRRLDVELDDLRRAMDWALRTANPERGLRLTSDLHWYWRARSPGEGRTRLDAALTHADGNELDRGHALVSLTGIALMTGDVHAAATSATEALDIGRRLDDNQLVGQALSFLGWLGVLGGHDPDEAPALFTEAVNFTRAAGDHPYTALALTGLGFARAGTSGSRWHGRRWRKA
ncbi:MAG: ATP-binding protein, partial [Acidimicrobiales bacterium]